MSNNEKDDTLHDILQILPVKIGNSYLSMHVSEADEKFPRMYTIGYEGGGIGEDIEASHANPTEAAKLMLRWCIENGYKIRSNK